MPASLGKKIAIRCKLSHLSAAFFEGLFGGYTQKIIKNYYISREIGGGNATAVEPSPPAHLLISLRLSASSNAR
jgi:hypothetical protein